MNLVEWQIMQELRRLDPDLFLDKENYHGMIMWCVKYNIGSGELPIRVLDWHEENKPLPLSLALVDRVKSFEGDITDAMAQAKRNNEQKRLEATKEFMEVAETIEGEFNRSARVLHRSGPWAPKHDVTAYRRSTL